MKNSWRRYILAFAITGTIFATAFYVAAWLDNARVAEIRSTSNAIALDILSSETQFELLGNLDCGTLRSQSILSDELNSLASRLSVAEENLGSTNEEVLALKKQYTLLEIKDYLLMERIAEKCNTKPVYVFYFYSNSGDCPDCNRMGDVLTYLRQEYPGLRVYSFDYHLDLGALETLKTINRLNGTLPALVIKNSTPVYGFRAYEDMKRLIPDLARLASSTASTTKR